MCLFPPASPISHPPSPKGGSALIVALWVLLILSLLIGSFAFDMHIEAGITSYYRKRMKSRYLAYAGVEWAKQIVKRSFEVNEDEEPEGEANEAQLISAINLSRGVAAQQRTQDLGEGKFTVSIVPEQGRYNVNMIDDEQWVEILDYSGVEQDEWDTLIDCFFDWVDENDEHLLNGAESDDSFYTERGYECKNAPLDTVSELLLIKGFTPAIVAGGQPEDEDAEPLRGIAPLLTAWGDGKINVNTAPREVLETIPGIDDYVVEAILEQRLGEDAEAGTRDDGFDSTADVMAIAGVDPSIRGRITTDERTYVRVESIGEVHGVASIVSCILRGDEKGVHAIFWVEESMD